MSVPLWPSPVSVAAHVVAHARAGVVVDVAQHPAVGARRAGDRQDQLLGELGGGRQGEQQRQEQGGRRLAACCLAQMHQNGRTSRAASALKRQASNSAAPSRPMNRPHSSPATPRPSGCANR